MVVLIVGLLVLISRLSGFSNRIEVLEKTIVALRKDIQKAGLSGIKPPPSQETIKEVNALFSPLPVEQKKKPEEKVEEKVVQINSDVVTLKPLPPKKVEVPVQKPEIPKVKQPSFFEKHPDVEKFIGENLINKIGIAILVIGIGFFVKYAIDQNWINAYGRVAIGVLCGGVLLGIAHYLRKTFVAFSSVLVGGGISVLYFTIGLAFHEYHIFSQQVAFIIMLVITILAVLLSVAYNRLELAVISLVGAFATPFMVSTGHGDYKTLFVYLLIIDAGMLVLVNFKKWNLINFLSYIFTYALFIGWYFKTIPTAQDLSVCGVALIFLTLFYLLFFVMGVLYNVKEKKKFAAPEILMLVSNTAIYFGFGLMLCHHIDGGIYKGLFTALVALFNFIFAYILYKKANIDKTLLYLLIGFVLTFVSLVGPIQLDGNQITLFWSAEAILLLWLSQKSSINLLKICSFAVFYLMMVSLVMDLFQHYNHNGSAGMMIMLNKPFLSAVFVLISIVGTYLLLTKEKDEKLFDLVEKKHYLLYLKVLGVVLLYVSLLLELNYQLIQYVDEYNLRIVILGIYHLTYVLALTLLSAKAKNKLFEEVCFILMSLVIMVYAVFYSSIAIDSRNGFLLLNIQNTAFYTHYILLLLFVVLSCFSVRYVRQTYGWKVPVGKIYLWIFAALLVFIGSLETAHLVVIAKYDSGNYIYDITRMINKTVYPVLWGALSFVFMSIGMRYKIATLRIVSLVLFGITLLKLFIFDLRDISEAGKIISFILLGVLLLVISFMYQKLKKIILDEEAEKKS